MSYTIKHQKTENVARRGFKSHPVRILPDNDLRTERSKNVARESQTEADKAHEVMLLVRGLAAEKTAWLWGSR